MRLDKFLANTLSHTRSEVKIFIKNGKVSVNGLIIKDSGFNVNDEDDILLNNKKISYQKYKYFVLNKPSGVVSATIDNFDKTVIDLLSEKDRSFKLFPVGRLDKDTEGLLILTNDGDFAHNSLSPKKHIDKTYYAHVDGTLSDKDIEAFKNGITIDKTTLLKSAKLKILESNETLSKCEVTISEGKFHQIKKMFLNVDRKVIYLKRIKFGTFSLPPDLNIGEYRELTENEIKTILGDNNE